MSKKKQEPVITIDEWIDAIMPKRIEKPDNAFTIEEVMIKTMVGRSKVVRKIRDLVFEKKLIEGSFIRNGKICKYFIPVELSK